MWTTLFLKIQQRDASIFFKRKYSSIIFVAIIVMIEPNLSILNIKTRVVRTEKVDIK
jgi:hypothetical protein